jgi:hypothetical protein
MIPLYQGDSAVFNLTLQDKNQAPISPGVWPPLDLTGCTFQLSIVKGSKDALIATVAGTITGSPTAGLASVTLDRTTSSGIAPGSYSARFEVLKGSTVQNTVYTDTLKVT